MKALEKFFCREAEIAQLQSLYQSRLPSPPVLVVHGLEQTGKTSIVKAALQDGKTVHAVVSSRECITGRHLLERIVSSCVDAVETSTDINVDRTRHDRCENLSMLAVHLQQLLENTERVVVVLDGIDKQREAPPTLLPALARLTEIIPALSLIFIVSVPRPRFLHRIGVPHIHFRPYDRDQSIQILSATPWQIHTREEDWPEGHTDEQASEDSKWVWARYLGVLWDAMAKGAARDLGSFRALAEKLWRPFVAPIVDGTYGVKDFSRLVVSRRAVFQDEDALIDSIVPKASKQTVKAKSQPLHELPYFSKFLLCAAYLASFNPARSDSIHFMKSTDKKKRKKGGASATGRASKHRKIPRHLLSPSLFALDRLLAIFHAIVPHRVPQTADIYTQIATLGALRLLLRSGAAGADVLDPACRWRVNFGLDYVKALGRSIEFELTDHLASAD